MLRGMIPIHHLMRIIEVIRHQVPNPDRSISHYLGIDCVMPTSPLRLRPHFLPKGLWATQMTDKGDRPCMGQINPVHCLRIQGRRCFNFKEAANFQLLPGFPTHIQHRPIHRSAQAHLRFYLYLARCLAFNHSIRPLIFLRFHPLQRFSPMLRQPPHTVFRNLDLRQFLQGFPGFPIRQLGAVLHRPPGYPLAPVLVIQLQLSIQGEKSSPCTSDSSNSLALPPGSLCDSLLGSFSSLCTSFLSHT